MQYFSAFEAYLADTLILYVTLNDDAVSALLKTDKTLREMKLGLSDVLADPDIVHAKICSYLRSVVFHRRGHVDALYRSVLGSGIIASKKTGDALARAIEVRHDCVHRNGFTSTGVRCAVFLPEYISNVASSDRSSTALRHSFPQRT